MNDLKICKIALLGATGHIAKSLIYSFSFTKIYKLYLFSRSSERLIDFLSQLHFEHEVMVKNIDDFNIYEYDVIINCIGVGDPQKVENIGGTIIKLTESFDNLIINYLEQNPKTLFINISSGAAYCTDFSVPADETKLSAIDVNKISKSDFYGVAKLYSEVKHRALSKLNIVDLRVFGYFTRFIDLNAKFFLSEIISCLKYNKDLITSNNNIIRDYVHFSDFFSLIELCIKKKVINEVFDVFSNKPVSKFEILDFYKSRYGLKCIITNDFNDNSITRNKQQYFSLNKKAQGIGYSPRQSSIDTIIKETQEIVL